MCPVGSGFKLRRDIAAEAAPTALPCSPCRSGFSRDPCPQPGRAAALIAGLLATTPLFAQAPTKPSEQNTIELPAATTPAVARRPQLEEIVVTAQRRSASLQDTPISLAAFNGEQLRVAGIDSLEDIGSKVPSLQIEPFPTSNATLRFFIRGIGLIDAQITQDPPIGVYLDGVYIARSSGNAFDIADLERIEVLRGPQGTLYGRNTTGGAINLITRKPDPTARAFSQTFTLGSRAQASAKTTLNLPLADTLALKLGLHGSTRDGFVTNRGPGGDFGDRESLAGKADLRWQPGAWTLDYSFEHSDVEYFNYLYQAVLTPEGDKGQAELIKREAQANSVYSQRRLSALTTGAPLEASLTRITGHALTMTRDFSRFELKYIGAYRQLLDAFYTDLGGGAGSTDYRLDTGAYSGPAATRAAGGPTPATVPFVEQRQRSHELQLSGSGWQDRLRWIGGVFYLQESAIESWNPLTHQLSSPINPLAQIPGLSPALRPVAPRLVSFIRILNEIDNTAAAAYLQGTWTPDFSGQRWHLTLGYRHSRDERAAFKTNEAPSFAEVAVAGVGVAQGLGAASEEETFDRVPGAFTFNDDSVSGIIEYDLAEGINLYAKYVEAYKAGGFNTRDPQVDGNSGPASDGNDYGFGFADGFDKEKVASIEAGFKSEWLDRRLRINLNLFRSDFEDMQINFILAGTVSDTKTTNAGRSRLQGLELDTNWLISADLGLDLSYALLDAEVLEVIDVNGDDVADRFQFNSAPRHSAAATARWIFLRRDWGALTAHFGLQHTGAREGGVNVGRPVDLPAHTLFDLRLGSSPLAFSGGALSLALWGRNLFDSEYEISAIDNLPHADRAVIWGEPRSVGLDLSYEF